MDQGVLKGLLDVAGFDPEDEESMQVEIPVSEKPSPSGKEPSENVYTDLLSELTSPPAPAISFPPAVNNPIDVTRSPYASITESPPSEIPGSVTVKQRRLLGQVTRENEGISRRIGFLEGADSSLPFYPNVETGIDTVLKRSFGTTMKVLEKFQIPQQVLFNTLKRVQEGKVSPVDFAEGIKKAVTGEEGTNTVKLWNTALDSLVEAGFLSKPFVEGVKESAPYKTLGFASDIVTDPLFVTGFGETKFGRISRVAKNADEMGTGIKLDSKAAKIIAEYYNVKTPTEEMIKAFPRPGKTVGERVSLGQTAPITVLGRPILRGKSVEQQVVDEAGTSLLLSRPAYKGKAVVQAVDSITKKAGASKAVIFLRDLLSTKIRHEELDNIFFKARKGYEFAADEEMRVGLDVAKRMRGVDVNQTNLISKVLDEGLDYTVVHPEALSPTKKGPVEVIPVVAKELEDHRTKYGLMAEIEESLGLLKSQMNYYFPRSASPKAVKLMRKMGDTADLSTFNLLPRGYKLRFAEGRSTSEFTLSEANEYFKKRYGIEEFFTRDPAVAMALRTGAHYRAVTQGEMWEDVVKKFGIHPADVKRYEDGVEVVGIPGLQNQRFLAMNEQGEKVPVHFDREIVEHLSKMNELLNDRGRSSQLYRGWNEVTNLWKGWTLAVFPEYHFRNMVTNFTNNFLRGVQPKDYYYAIKTTKGANGHVIDVTGNKLTFNQLDKEMKKWSVDGLGLFGAELPDRIRNVVEKGQDFTSLSRALRVPVTKDILNPTRDNQMMQLGFAVGRSIENNARRAHYISRRRMGDTPIQAAKSVAKYLFDYNDLTKFEKDLKQFLPFMKWTKENIPLQFVNLFKQPWKYTIVSKGRAAYLEEGEVNQMLYPEMTDFLRENVPIRMRVTPEGDHEYLTLGYWWGGADIEKMLHPLDTFISLLHPAFTQPLTMSSKLWEYASPRAAKEFEKEQAQSVKFIGVPMSRSTMNRLKAMRLLTTADRFISAMRELDATESGGAEQTHPFLKWLTGLRTYKTNPAKDVLYRRLEDRDVLRAKLRKLKDLQRQQSMEE